jgi:hypothetical protein
MSNETNRLPEFYELLNEAQAASDAMDAFDLDSSKKESREQWERLVKASSEASGKLVTFVQQHKELLPQIYALTLSPTSLSTEPQL